MVKEFNAKNESIDEIRIGVSSCLLGNEVRFDGTHERNTFLMESIATSMRCIAVCPEVDIGLGVPRQTIRLVGTGEATRLVATQSGLDHTATMQAYAETKIAELEKLEISGYVFKSASPSCGLQSTKIYNEQGTAENTGSGMFAAALVDRLPDLPMLEENDLQDPARREAFLVRVRAYHRHQQQRPPGV